VKAEKNGSPPIAEHQLDSQQIPLWARARILGGWFLTVLLGTLILVAPLPLTGQLTVKQGDVAPADVSAPRQVTYVSEILTQQRRDLAAKSVPDVYDPPQARVSRQQLTLATQWLDFVASVRSDTLADPATRLKYLRTVTNPDLPPELLTKILSIPNAKWDLIAGDVQAVLDRAMREEIRESNLPDEKRRVPAWVRLDLSDDDAMIVSQIVQPLMVPNSFYNPTKTDERRKQASDRVEQVTATIERNEKVLRAGDIVTALDIEALDAIGLKQTPWSWQDLRAAAAMMLVLGVVFVYYLWRQEPAFWLSTLQPILLAAVVLTFLVAARALVPAHALLPYIFPYAALTMLLTVGTNLRISLVATAVFAFVIGWMTNGSLELMIYAYAASLIGTLKLRRGERLASFAWAGAFVALVNIAVVVAFRLGAGKVEPRALLELSTAGLVNGLVTATISLLGIYALGAFFGLITPLQLMELSRPTHPLLRQLLLKAPGTYHHTLIVSNMAERAASAIGADAQLARVGAYYHDVGKSIRPYFFAENRTEATDPHGRLDPYTSAQIIISHVKDGIELARKYHLPRRVIDFIPEHQGTQLVTYFYHEAVKQAGSADRVDRSQFVYPGPRPRSRETAITMLADGAEAVVRSKSPASAEELRKTIGTSIQSRISAGQLDECPLTLAELQLIQAAFMDVLRGLHHPRVSYPSEPKGEPGAEAGPAEEQDATSHRPNRQPQTAA
jgi:cyclic-di-AMP phosphodiesterase PgpH